MNTKYFIMTLAILVFGCEDRKSVLVEEQLKFLKFKEKCYDLSMLLETKTLTTQYFTCTFYVKGEYFNGVNDTNIDGVTLGVQLEKERNK